MGIEQLNTAAWAAGFAMAASEDDYEVVRPVETQWSPGRAIMVREANVERADWVRALLGLFGRRARVSSARASPA